MDKIKFTIRLPLHYTEQQKLEREKEGIEKSLGLKILEIINNEPDSNILHAFGKLKKEYEKPDPFDPWSYSVFSVDYMIVRKEYDYRYLNEFYPPFQPIKKLGFKNRLKVLFTGKS